MKIYLLFHVLIIAFLNTRAQQLPQYHITATLNEKDHSLDGFLAVDYTNNSTDSLHFLWFNIYPNAFKSDRTAFSEYMLSKGKTDFYFADPSERGYINRLDFRSGDNILKTEDHPQYIDVIKVFFDEALAPGGTKEITTLFHVKLPYNFDGIGYKEGRYDLKYWYPAIAEYVRPFTSVDSSSNMVANYHVVFSGNGKDSTIIVSSVRDISLTVLKAQEKNKVRSTASEHDIFKFLKRDARNKSQNDRPTWDSSINKKITKVLSLPVLPAVGYNEYDGFQLGIVTQNFEKQKPFTYYLAPVYTFRSKSIAGVAGASLVAYPKNYLKEIQFGFSASTFSYQDGVNSNNEKVFARLIKVVPYIKATLPSQQPQTQKTFTFKTYIPGERDLKFERDTGSQVFHQSEGSFATRYINELTFDYLSNRVLYPYHAQLQVQQADNWYRVNATGNYFFNYAKGGGMNVRVFAAKFGYIGNVTSSEKFEKLRYMPKLTAVRGGEDYSYSNYFIGRNNFEGFASRQIMMRDGGLKLRTDLFEGLQGRSDDWVASVNLNSNIPFLPAKFPLKAFFDAGTYAEAWDDNNPNPRFLYVAGLQLSLFRDVLNIYAPVFYSRQFRDQLKSVPEENKFLRKVSFSIDIQKISLKKLL